MKFSPKQVRYMEQEWFENFLRDKHYDEHPMLLDDDLPDHYDNWVASLTEEQILTYAQEHHSMMASWVAQEFIKRNF